MLNSALMLGRERFKYGDIELEILTDSGPRLIGLYVRGVKGNLLVETPDIVQETPHGAFYLRGGHRLWEAPERWGVTGLPDTQVEIGAETNGFRVSAAPNAIGLSKAIKVMVDGLKLTLEHRMANESAQALTLAPWAITQLAPGGAVWVPAAKAAEGEDKMPDRNTVLWPYSNADKAGITWSEDGMRFDPAAVDDPFKFGTYAGSGRVQVQYADYKFSKTFGAQHAGHYPDRGCNLEFYVANDYLEVETLGPLQELKPGEELRHDEVWEIEVKPSR